VLRGVRVGRGCVLAAHTVVTTDVPDYSIVAGVPGRVVRSRISSR
jgi:acetyltransferase-like isoleucine patch superfamily enzyme